MQSDFKKKVNVFWFRRDLRIDDNTALNIALSDGLPCIPLFIFDEEILDDLPANDARVSFIYSCLQKLNDELSKSNSSLLAIKGNVKDVWTRVLEKYEVNAVFANRDYEPSAIKRDQEIAGLMKKKGIEFNLFKDQVIFDQAEILNASGKPYTVFTPYKKMWIKKFNEAGLPKAYRTRKENFFQKKFTFPSLSEIGFSESSIEVKQFCRNNIKSYALNRDLPSLDAGTYAGAHLRFGTISVRDLIKQSEKSEVFRSELIWREFFMQILYHFPYVVTGSFRKKYDNISWINNEKDFRCWCEGKTGYPLVDAGMRQLNETGYMHNRVRMVVASFLCKHLLIDWRWGEAYFAEKLLDYELSSNNGNWQWAAGCGCDAAPYFRVFNPETQQKKFDKDFLYINKWIPEFEKNKYISPIVEHSFARDRAIKTYKKALAE
ncbi:MAG: deoxyribodipyrimidine photolyase [Bacteroidetes bacterium GWF2_38_335]|nr:MAG: deoxyribodipyrimidine photolyase [Bacteroidetes bacterium GWF2_38_335]OFY79173.1 MAG: deoxyribodipyrimidine photolyase [Bacteroidetes bacterium RIFOXYA12_FULL_38_20]HBS86149.1 deoxyribodipyrimidine photolyase [Bacteroidales bacterium]